MFEFHFQLPELSCSLQKYFSLSFKRQDIYRVFMKQTVKEDKEPTKPARIKNSLFNKLNEIKNRLTKTYNSLQILFLLEQKKTINITLFFDHL